MYIKTTVRFQLTSVRMAIFQKPETVNAGEDVGKLYPNPLLVGI